MGKILMVDDEKNVLSSFKKVFSREGHTVVTAGNAEEGLSCTQKDAFDLLVCDDKNKAQKLAQKLNQANIKRQQELDKAIQVAIAKISQNKLDKNKIILVFLNPSFFLPLLRGGLRWGKIEFNAFISGSILKTIPGPPPYGFSSTVLCLSVANLRRFIIFIFILNFS